MSTNNTEPDWSKVKLSDQYDWVDGVSANGKLFKIGTPKSDSQPPAANKVEDLRSNAAVVKDKHNFDITVDWPGVPTPQGFIPYNTPSDEETRITSITSWFLSEGGADYNEFTFSCTESYDFWFYTTKDKYENNVFWPRPWTTHIISFFESNPTIVRITGS